MMPLLEVMNIAVLSSAVVVVLGSSLCPVFEPCPAMWQPWRGSCYRLTIPPGRDRYDARATCRGMGGEMAAPRSLEENQFMVDLVKSVSGNDGYLMIGCHDIDLDGKWVCEGDGDDWPFLNWQPDQPAINDCAEIYVAGSNTQWRSKPCFHAHHAICVRRSRDACVHRSAQPACGYRLTQPRRYCFATDSNGQILNYCLLDHVIREFAIKSNPICASACIMEPGCRSFNIKHNDQGQKICQINNENRCDDPDKFQDIGSFCLYAQECVD